MEALGGVASIIAVVDLSAKVLSLCSQYFKEVKNAKSDIEELQKVVANVQTQHEKTRTLLEGRMGFLLETSQQLIKGHHGCKRELKDLISALEQNINTRNGSPRIMRKFGWRALKWPFDATTVQGTTEKLQKFQEDMTNGLIIDQTGFGLSNIEHSFFQSISSIPYEKHHNSNSEKRASDTCEWLLLHKKFVEWQNSDSQVILWLQGQVGAGKTCLVSKAVDYMRWISEASPDEGFAFFYCDHQEESRRKPVSILLSLLRQLLLSSTGHHEVEKELYDRWQSQKSQEIGLNLVECQEYLCRLIDESAKTTIILDAMDECEPTSRRSIIEGLKTISKKCHKPLRILVASRPERDIRDRLSAVSNIEVREEYNEEDIQAFVKEEIINHGNWSNMPFDIQIQIEETIMDQSHGMFQWAALQVQQLLEEESISNIKHRLGRLPKNLEGTYDELFNAIRIRKGTDRLLAENALKWVMCALKPLGKEELLSAIRLKIESDEFVLLEEINQAQLLKLCNHLLVFDTERGVWEFAHFSVAEYLEDIGLGYYKSHSDVAKACLKLLNQTYVGYDWDEDNGQMTHGTTATDDIFRKDHPIQLYSRHHWIIHAKTQESTKIAEQDSEEGRQAVDISLVLQLQNFMGSFSQSSPQYRCWVGEIDLDGCPPRTSAFYSFYNKRNNRWSRGNPKTFRTSDTISPKSASILLASRFSLYKLLKDWWEAEFELTQTNRRGSNLLALAAAGGSIPICTELLRRGINVGEQRADCAEALTEALDNGHIDVVNLLVKTGKIDPNAKIESNGNILVRAIVQKQLEAIRTIVQEGRADVNAVLVRDNYPRHKLKRLNSIWSLFIPTDQATRTDKLLMANRYGSALAAAAGTGRMDVVEYLVQEGQADVNTALEFGRYGSALAAAASKGHLEVVKFLVQEGQANVNMPLQCGDHGTALSVAASKGHLEVVKFLVQEGHAEVNMALHRGRSGTALVSATQRGRLDIVKFLVENCGAKINLPEDIRLQCGLPCDALEAAYNQPRPQTRLEELRGMKMAACGEFFRKWEEGIHA